MEKIFLYNDVNVFRRLFLRGNIVFVDFLVHYHHYYHINVFRSVIFLNRNFCGQNYCIYSLSN